MPAPIPSNSDLRSSRVMGSPSRAWPVRILAAASCTGNAAGRGNGRVSRWLIARMGTEERVMLRTALFTASLLIAAPAIAQNAPPPARPAPVEPTPQVNRPAPTDPTPQVNRPAPTNPTPQVNRPAPTDPTPQ